MKGNKNAILERTLHLSVLTLIELLFSFA